MTEHAKFGASNAKRRMGCPGSLKAEAPFPNESSPYAELGTAAHELGEFCLVNGHEDAFAFIGEEHNGHKVDDNMARAVQVYIDYIRDVASTEPNICRYEKRFSLDKLDPPMPMFGTADCIIYGKESGTLYVIDYKHGQGIAVEVEDNAQLKYYALGAILEIGEKAPVNKVITVVVQPRAMHPDGPVREYSYSRDEIMDFGTELIDAAHEAMKPDAARISGKHCTFCLAAGTCSALRNNALEIAQDEFGTVRNINDLSPQEIADFLQRVPLIEEWIKSLRRHANNILDAGAELPGYKLVEKRPTRRWRVEEEVVAWATEEGLDDDDIYEKKLKSPPQIERLVGKKNLPTSLVIAVSSGTSMVADTDNRPAVALLAADEFTVE
jgi:hypothetical protein